MVRWSSFDVQKLPGWLQAVLGSLTPSPLISARRALCLLSCADTPSPVMAFSLVLRGIPEVLHFNVEKFSTFPYS